ncbi:MAG: hypothetical protein WA666_07300 [Nitrospirota bacterium]
MPGASFTAVGFTPLNFSVNPSYPGKVTLDPGLVPLKSEGGEDIFIRKGNSSMLIALNFIGLPVADFDGGFDYAAGAQASGSQSLVNWFISLSGKIFTYADPFGKSHSVVFGQDKLEFSLMDDGAWGGTLLLKEIIG